MKPVGSQRGSDSVIVWRRDVKGWKARRDGGKYLNCPPQFWCYDKIRTFQGQSAEKISHPDLKKESHVKISANLWDFLPQVPYLDGS